MMNRRSDSATEGNVSTQSVRWESRQVRKSQGMKVEDAGGYAKMQTMTKRKILVFAHGPPLTAMASLQR